MWSVQCRPWKCAKTQSLFTLMAFLPPDLNVHVILFLKKRTSDECKSEQKKLMNEYIRECKKQMGIPPPPSHFILLLLSENKPLVSMSSPFYFNLHISLAREATAPRTQVIWWWTPKGEPIGVMSKRHNRDCDHFHIKALSFFTWVANRTGMRLWLDSHRHHFRLLDCLLRIAQFSISSMAHSRSRY